MLLTDREGLNPFAPFSKKNEKYRDYSQEERWQEVRTWFKFNFLEVPIIIIIIVVTVVFLFGSGPSYHGEDTHVPQRYR
jgi:hypothetical protein